MSTITADVAWDILTDEFDVSEDTIKVVTCINGYSLKVLEDILYAVSGYRSFEQVMA